MEDDEWGRDPSVRGMRRVFAALEEAQGRLLGVLGISVVDRRLGTVRRMSLHLFEQHWTQAVRNRVQLTEQDLADLYVYCLARALETKGVAVPKSSLPGNGVIEALMEGGK